jgi:ABC-type tungstate transport system permease subunit
MKTGLCPGRQIHVYPVSGQNRPVIVFESGENLLNLYHVIAVNPARFPRVIYDLARQYIDFITG